MLFHNALVWLDGIYKRQGKIISAKIKPIYPNPVNDEQIYKIRKVLCENSTLIDDYIFAVKLAEEKAQLLKSWRDHHKKVMLFVVDFKPEYAVILGSNAQNEDGFYGAKGISRSLSDATQRDLPIQLETVLLPFGDKIIYDNRK